MKRTIVVMSVAAAAVLSLSACGGGNSTGASPEMSLGGPVPQQAFDTAQVLSLAQQSSENSTPFSVGLGIEATFTDTSETSSPISINGM